MPGPEALTPSVGWGVLHLFCKVTPHTDPVTAHLSIRAVKLEHKVEAKTTEIVFRDVKLPKGDARLEAWLHTGSVNAGMMYVEVERTRE